MDGAGRETEIKLRFDSAEEALARLRPLGPKPVGERIFEDNILFDREHEPLAPAGKLLRLRRVGSRALLTFKAPMPGEHRHKVRLEEETHLSDPQAMERVLSALGFTPWYRYQKHRTVFTLDDLQLCLDETPLGCFLEIEGPPESIDRAAARLGFDVADYITESYLELHERSARERGEARGDLLLG
jgi:adenylate cyclase class 2